MIVTELPTSWRINQCTQYASLIRERIQKEWSEKLDFSAEQQQQNEEKDIVEENKDTPSGDMEMRDADQVEKSVRVSEEGEPEAQSFNNSFNKNEKSDSKVPSPSTSVTRDDQPLPPPPYPLEWYPNCSCVTTFPLVTRNVLTVSRCLTIPRLLRVL